MDVVLMARQVMAIDRVVRDPALLREMQIHRDPYGRAGSIISAPYVAWVMVRDVMVNATFKPSGALGRVPRAQAGCVQRIVKAINTMDRHPALRQVAMSGIMAGVFPVWEALPSDPFKRVWTPMPTPGQPFCILWPQWHFDEGYTAWVAKPVEDAVGLGDGRLRDEKTHLALIGL